VRASRIAGIARRWHRKALAQAGPLPDGTYELIGPKVQGNAERRERHMLVPHGAEILPGVPRDFEGIRVYLAGHEIEGVVWWRAAGDPECDKAKIKRRDFKLPWPPKRG